MNFLHILQLVPFWLCFVNWWIVGLGNICPDPDGGHVSWWILYQEKSRPFFHFYADSRNNQDIKVTLAVLILLINCEIVNSENLNKTHKLGTATQVCKSSISLNSIAHPRLISKMYSVRCLRFWAFTGFLFAFYVHYLFVNNALTCIYIWFLFPGLV